jgi:hypothetical protein
LLEHPAVEIREPAVSFGHIRGQNMDAEFHGLSRSIVDG